MTSTGPDDDLDQALGITELPPAAVTEDHLRRGADLRDVILDGSSYSDARLAAAQAIADAEQRGAARVLAEHATAGTPVPGGDQ